MAKNKNRIVYQQEDERLLSSEELNSKLIQELTRRVDNIIEDLYSSDSECSLRKIPDFEKRLDNIVRHIAMNENEFRIFRDIVAEIQREFYPMTETKCAINKSNTLKL